MTDIKQICKEDDYPFEVGKQKKAYATKECVNFTSDKDPSKMVIVNFKDDIKWISTKDSNRHQRTRHREQILKFKSKMINEPLFKYGIQKLIDNYIAENPDWDKKKKEAEEAERKKAEAKRKKAEAEEAERRKAEEEAEEEEERRQAEETAEERERKKTEKEAEKEAERKKVAIQDFNEIINIETLVNWFENYDEQFNIINELKKMIEFGKLGLAPIIYQIRINNGAPFSPDEIDAQIAKLPDGEPVQFSYMVEKCGGDHRYINNILTFVDRYPLKDDDVARKICEFCDKFVDTTESVNCDFKYQNLCPMIVETKDKRDHKSHEIVSIRMLDVDPNYAIEKKGDPDFSRHGKVFMKFLMFAHLNKRGARFYKWGVSDVEVREMIAFFYGMDYMIYEFNPINMMYFYLIEKSPGKEKIGFDNLKTKYPTDAEMIAVFEPYIRIAKPFDVPKTVFDVAKGRKSKKVKKTRKAQRTRRVR